MKKLGKKIENWLAPSYPNKEILRGHYCQLEKLDLSVHGEDLWKTLNAPEHNTLWDYLPYGPFSTQQEFYTFLQKKSEDRSTLFYAIKNLSANQYQGLIAYARIQADIGSIEVSHVCFSLLLQKTTPATEAVYLMIDYIFSLGYRRCEWKCNNLNKGSKKAAARLGFQYEGCFRQATIIKGRNRDTDWYSILDKEWERLKPGYAQWLHASNFDKSGQQIKQLTANS